MAHAMTRLTHRQAQVLATWLLYDQDAGEAAAVLGISAKGVRAVVRRAKRKIYLELDLKWRRNAALSIAASFGIYPKRRARRR